MQTDQWDRIRELFDEVSQHPPEARRKVLDELCPDDASLRAEVQSLLEHDDRAAAEFMQPLDRAPFVPPNEGVMHDSLPPYQGGIEGGSDSLIGARIGKYTIRRVIAGGGMGRVYEAEQDHPKRTVALKVVPTWAWSPAGLRRFEFEVQALARLTHPNIAQIYDAGTFGGNVETPKNRNAETDDPSLDQSRRREPTDIPNCDVQSRRREPTDILPNDGSMSDEPVTGLAPGALTHGIPYFVMEFVPNAMPITDYAERHELAVRQRLELFLQLCDAVHYGHQKGIIHRDLKPGNILVGEDCANPSVERERHDQSPVQTTNPLPAGRGSDQAAYFTASPLIKGGQRGVASSCLSASVPSCLPLVKVIDFGIAKATDSDVTATTMHTEIGQLVGSLSYMSPEQCAADPLALDVRSDVYSLGVVLYQLLCGCLPYVFFSSRADLSRRRKPADKPSRDDQSRGCKPTDRAVPNIGDIAERVTGLAPGALIPNPLSMLRTICEVSPIRPSTIHRAVRGDLEIILLKTLEKDRHRRYQSAADLARDIRHYLAREPIEARGPSLASSAFLWTRRHPILTTAFAAATVGSAVLAAFFVSLWLVHFRPYKIVRSEDTRKAVLMSVSGNVLRTWKTTGRNGITPAEILEIPNAVHARLAVIGYPSTHAGPLRGKLCAYDMDAKEYESPLWTSAIEPEDVPNEEPKRNFKAEDFYPEHLFTVDNVFPEVPGDEIVVTFAHSYSRRAVRVYSAEGEVLFQLWHDGDVISAFWLPTARLLVLAGTNGEVPWHERRGAPTTHRFYPWVVWAIGPELGNRCNKYACTDRFKNCVPPAWYECVLPAESTDVFAEVNLNEPPQASLDDGAHFLLALTFRTSLASADLPAIAGWVVDAEGKKAADSWYRGDAYIQLKDKLPRIEDFYLGDLPPIVAGANDQSD